MKNEEEVRIAALKIAQNFNPLSVELLIELAKPLEQYILGQPEVVLPKVMDGNDLVAFLRAKQSVVAFAEMLKILHPEKGLILFEPNVDQLAIFAAWEQHNWIYLDMDRQQGTSTALLVLLLHSVIFNNYKTSVFMALKMDAAKEFRQHLNVMMESLPSSWVNLTMNNKYQIEFDNGSTILFSGSNVDAIRGRSISNLFVDQAGFIPNTNGDYLLDGVLPSIASSKTSKMVFASTGYEAHRGSTTVQRLEADTSFEKVRSRR